MFTSAETAAYIATMSEDLAKMASDAGLDALAHVLSMAVLASRCGDCTEPIRTKTKAA